MAPIKIRIVINEDKCIGCRACELACSYHHREVFDPEISSIEILQQGEEEAISAIVYRENGKDRHLVCDQCSGEGTPLCLKYCDRDAIYVVR